MNTPSRGFTLLELIVVIAIFGVLSLMAYGGLNSVLKSRARIEQHLDRTAQFQKAYQRLRNDFQQLRNRPVRDSYGDIQPPLRGDRDTRVEFTRAGWRNPQQAPRPSLERVSYRLVEHELRRESWRELDQAQDSKLVSLTLLDGIDEMRLRYLDKSREWIDSWPPLSSTGGTQASATAAPPLAIEITLKTRDWGDIKFLFRAGLDPLPTGFVAGAQASGTGTQGTTPAAGNNLNTPGSTTPASGSSSTPSTVTP